jgi:hypothetical protein
MSPIGLYAAQRGLSMTDALRPWPRIRSYVLRPDGSVVFTLTCSHTRIPAFTPLAQQKSPEWFLGKKWPCDRPGCTGAEVDLPEAREGSE